MINSQVQSPGRLPVSQGVLAQACPAPPQQWHAHLSAIQRPAAAAGAVEDGESGRNARSLRKQVTGTSLHRAVTGVGVLIRSASKGGAFLTRGDGKNAPQWVIREVDGSQGEYSILVAGDDGGRKFLSAMPEGRDVELRNEDDGSGRQRWVFREVGDAQYTIRLAGGKRDERVYLGVREDSTPRLFAEEKGDRTEWEVVKPDKAKPDTDGDKPDKAKPDGAKPDEGKPDKQPETKVPRQVVPELVALTSLTEKDIDVILQLISLPENATPAWWTNYNYIEFLGDGRGFTVTLYGACSGTHDLAMIFDELAKISPRSNNCDELLKYRDILKKKRGDDIKGIEPIKKIIKGLGEDLAWQQAVWKVYVKLYWRFAMEWADKKGDSAKRPGPPLRLPLTRGFMVDTAINHGANYESFMDIVKRMPESGRNSKDELAWFTAFADAREKMLKSGYQDLDTSKTGDRCRLWKDVAAQGNTQLRPPFKAYKGYWGSFTIK